MDDFLNNLEWNWNNGTNLNINWLGHWFRPDNADEENI